MDNKEEIRQMSDTELDDKIKGIYAEIQKSRHAALERLDRLADEYMEPGVVRFQNISSTGISFYIGEDNGSMFNPTIGFVRDSEEDKVVNFDLNMRLNIESLSLYDTSSDRYVNGKRTLKAMLVFLCNADFRRGLIDLVSEAIREFDELTERRYTYYAEVTERKSRADETEKKRKKIELFNYIEESIRGQQTTTDSYLRVFCPKDSSELSAPYFFVYRAEKVEPCADNGGRYFFNRKLPNMRTYAGTVKYVPVNQIRNSENKKLL